MNTQKIASIDIGSNSIKLAVIEAAASDALTIIYRDKDIVRLGHETLSERHLSPEAINRAAESIGRFRVVAENRGAEKILIVATASVREADNANEFIETIESKTGVRVEILSPIEEARVIGIGVASLCADGDKSLLNIDIGGGSTEISLMRNGEPEKLFSMKLGAVGLTERFLKHNPPNDKEIKLLQANIRSAVERPTRELTSEKFEFATGTSGTILALGRIVNFNATTKTTAPKAEISLAKLAELNVMLSRLSIVERQKIPEVSSQRAEIIIAGGQILEGVMRALKIKSLRPCEYALREGVIIDYLRETEAENMPPVPDVEDKRLRGVFAVGRRFGYEESHSLQVANVAEKIFDALQPIENMPRHDRTLLSAAALLHDIGYHIAHESHHKHSLYLIKHSELTGFSEPERLIIANVARYHRGSTPKDKHFDFITLSDVDRQTVWKLGAILRLADTLDRTYRGDVAGVVFTRNGKDMLVEIVSDADYQSELETAMQKTEMFEAAFDCRLIFMRRPLTAKV